MGKFRAELELPRFILRDDILGKEVFDNNLLYVGKVADWDYSSDGIIKMILKNDNIKLSIIIPFYFIEKVGNFIELKVSRTQFIKDIGSIKEPVEMEARKAIRNPLIDKIESSHQ